MAKTKQGPELGRPPSLTVLWLLYHKAKERLLHGLKEGQYASGGYGWPENKKEMDE